MSTLIGIKDFRKTLAFIASEVMKGKTYTVMRRSKPVFDVKPYKEEEEEFDDPNYKTLIDFTEGGKKEGIDAEEFYRIMKEFEEKHEQNRKISK